MEISTTAPMKWLIALVMASGCVMGLSGQISGRPASPRPELTESRVPPAARMVLTALGNRLTSTGRERMIWSGSIADSRGAVPVVITTEFPGKIRVEESSGRLIGFDGSSGWSGRGALQDNERDILESLTGDTAEGFLQAVVQGAPGRLLGRRFRTDNGKSPDYSGPYFDIYELVVAPPSRSDRQASLKRYYFDSRTGRLHKVVYAIQRAGQRVQVAVSYDGWKVVESQAVPQRIVRMENGQQVLAIQIQGVQFQPAGDGASFRRP